MAADLARELQDHVAEANDVITVNLVRDGSSEVQSEEPFHPDMTYPIFGEEEQIFGYTDLQIKLNFRANDLWPSLDISYKKEWKSVGETKPMDIRKLMEEFMPKGSTARDRGPPPAVSKDWKPPGTKVLDYTLHGKKFEIWRSTLGDPATRELFDRMQIFITFYIEAGQHIELNDPQWTLDRWKLFTLYEIADGDAAATTPYTFAGFCTTYRLWVLPSKEVLVAAGQLPPSPPASNNDTPDDEDAYPVNDPDDSWRPEPLPVDSEASTFTTTVTPLDSPSRERISQFIILPPYRGQSHGAHLYNTVASLFLTDRNVFEITVEDPNERFDDLRDWCDLARLRRDPAFASLSLPTNLPTGSLAPTAAIPVDILLPQPALAALRRRYKIAPRQFARLAEMQLLSAIPAAHRSTARITRRERAADANDRAYYFWRLLVKERIYRRNVDQLAQLERSERVEKVEESLAAVQDEYVRILKGAERRGKLLGVAGGEAGGVKRRKRVVDDDDEDEEEVGRVAGKKPKV